MDDVSNKVILDSSALIALITEETGHEIVQQVLPKAIMSSINVSEVAKYFLERQLFERHSLELLIKQLIAEVVPFDLAQSFDNAELYLTTKLYGLSLGDRACLGLGLSSEYSVYTADKIWAQLSIANLKVIVIR